MRADRRDRRLMRYLHGELPALEVRRLRAELAQDPALAARLAELERVWQRLELPPPTAVPRGFATQVTGSITVPQRTSTLTGMLAWVGAPRWERAVAAVALAGGLGVGLVLGNYGLAGAFGPDGHAAAAAVSSPDGGGTTVPRATASPPDAGSTARAPLPAPSVAPGQTGTASVAPVVAAAAPLEQPFAGDSTLAEDYWQALLGEADLGNPENDGT